MSGTVIPSDRGLIGISYGLRYNGPITKTRYTVFEALPEAIRNIGNVISLSVQGIASIVRGKTDFDKSVAGPIKIAQLASQSAGLGIVTYLSFMAFLSISLAILNILPIPALDGGHVAFLLYEVVTRRKPSEKFLEYAQIVGMVIIFSLLIFANTNDILRWLRNMFGK